ncbi:MAG: hypothetical protein J6386_06765 [Candidatus Synoicihabitans palmerolidicus]|nr:hypothetical protein [Candidatus Synoicihabitans palmerolidicus]
MEAVELQRDPEPRLITPAAAGSVTILSAEDTRPSARVTSTGNTSVASAAPSEAVVSYLERSKVTGVRTSATDPKVLMNDRVYRLEEFVDRDLQLRVIAIEPRELKFRDPRGVYVYPKTF